MSEYASVPGLTVFSCSHAPPLTRRLIRYCVTPVVGEACHVTNTVPGPVTLALTAAGGLTGLIWLVSAPATPLSIPPIGLLAMEEVVVCAVAVTGVAVVTGKTIYLGAVQVEIGPGEDLRLGL